MYVLFNYYSDNDDPTRCQDNDNQYCWNGTANVTMNNVDFTNQTVAGQGMNPVAAYNVTELERFSENMSKRLLHIYKFANCKK